MPAKVITLRSPFIVHTLPQRGKPSAIYQDIRKFALKPGKRVSSTGHVYWETRKNRSDKKGTL